MIRENNIVLSFTNKYIVCQLKDDYQVIKELSSKDIQDRPKKYKTTVKVSEILADELIPYLKSNNVYYFLVQNKSLKYHGKIKVFINKLREQSIQLIGRK